MSKPHPQSMRSTVKKWMEIGLKDLIVTSKKLGGALLAQLEPGGPKLHIYHAWGQKVQLSLNIMLYIYYKLFRSSFC